MLRRMMMVVGFAWLAAPAWSQDWPGIKKRGTLRVLAMLVEREPEFFSVKAGVPPGLDHEILQGFAQLHGLKLEVVPVASWDVLVPALLDGKGDVIAGRFTVTDARKAQIAFTVEVFPTRLVVVTRKPHRMVRSVEELREEKVGTVKGTSLADAVALAAVPASRVDAAIPAGGLVEALQSGRVTASIFELYDAIAIQRRDPSFQLGLFVGPPGSFAYGVRRDHPALVAAMNEYIQNTRRTPTWFHLVSRYFGAAAPDILMRISTDSR